MRAYQRISFSITHWNLFAGGALPGHGVAIEAHVLGPQLEQRRPLVVLGGGCPGVGVHHPLGRILPGRSPPIQLKEHKTMSNISTISPSAYLTKTNVPWFLGCGKHPNDTQSPWPWHWFGRSWPPSLRLQCPSLGTSWRKKHLKITSPN